VARTITVAALLLFAGCRPSVVVVEPQQQTDVGVATALEHTLFADDLGCTAVNLGRGFVATAEHCVDDLELGAHTKLGMVLYTSATRDFAILFDSGRLVDPEVCIRAPVLGEHLYAVGYPVQLGNKKQELTVTDGLFAGPQDDDGSYRITAPIYYGNSGGGAWAEDGCLLGLTVSGFLTMPAMNYIVVATDIEPWIPR
jgi:hypothetical protein